MEPDSKNYRIVLIDDHKLEIVCKGLLECISNDPSFRIIHHTHISTDFLLYLQNNEVDVVIFDLAMPDITGMQAIQSVRATCSSMKILVLTMHEGKESCLEALAAGADGYFRKDRYDENLLVAIEAVVSGKTYVSQGVLELPADGQIKMEFNQFNTTPYKLTIREQQVKELMLQGFTTKQMASCLNLSSRTIDHHRQNVLKKMRS